MTYEEADEKIKNVKAILVFDLNDYIDAAAKDIKQDVWKASEDWVERNFNSTLNDNERQVVTSLTRATIFQRVSLFLSDARYVAESGARHKLMKEAA